MIVPYLEDHPRTRKWLGINPYLQAMEFGHLEGEQPYFGDLLSMVINQLLIGMILQVRILSLQKSVHFDPQQNPFILGPFTGAP